MQENNAENFYTTEILNISNDGVKANKGNIQPCVMLITKLNSSCNKIILEISISIRDGRVLNGARDILREDTEGETENRRVRPGVAGAWELGDRHAGDPRAEERSKGDF